VWAAWFHNTVTSLLLLLLLLVLLFTAVGFHPVAVVLTLVQTKSTKNVAVRAEIFSDPLSLCILGPTVFPPEPDQRNKEPRSAHRWTTFVLLTGPSSSTCRPVYIFITLV
jgi:hypothetical protein